MDNNKQYFKSIDESNDYMSIIFKKCEENIVKPISLIKIKDEEIKIPTLNNYHDLYKYNYNISQLKTICKHYKLKLSGNKSELVMRIYSYFHFSFYAIKIQKIFRGYFVKKYNSLHGPASHNRKLCTNEADFVTMEPLEEIDFHHFISYKDIDGFIYGFDLSSLFNLFNKMNQDFKSHKAPENPYNRNKFSDDFVLSVKKLIKYSRMLKIKLNLVYEDDTKNVSGEKAIELRALKLFQTIDSLGNYSDYHWFLSLNKQLLIKFIKELSDIWNYRAQLSALTKVSICPPRGDPFTNLSIQYIYTENNIQNIQKVILEVLEKLVNSGTDKDNKSLGACYVLGALTLVNHEASTALPWLFYSFNHE